MVCVGSSICVLTCSTALRERLLSYLDAQGAAQGSATGSSAVTTVINGREVAAPDIVGIWNNQVPNVSAALKKNVLGVISQV